MKRIHISQNNIRDNANLGTDYPVIAVHDGNGTIERCNEYTISEGIRIVYNPEGIELDGSLIRVWIEVGD